MGKPARPTLKTMNPRWGFVPDHGVPWAPLWFQYSVETVTFWKLPYQMLQEILRKYFCLKEDLTRRGGLVRSVLKVRGNGPWQNLEVCGRDFACLSDWGAPSEVSGWGQKR